MMVAKNGWQAMSYALAHVICIVTVAICSAVLGMAHVISGGDLQTIYVGCLASFSAHGVTATIKGNASNGGNNNV